MKKCLIFALTLLLAFGLFGIGANVQNISVSAASSSAKNFFQNMPSAPTLAYAVAGRESYERLKSRTSFPQNAIWTLGESMTVLDEKGEGIGDFEELRQGVPYNVIDNFYITSEAALAGLSAYAEENNIYDFSMIASDPELLRNAKDTIPQARGAIDFSENLPEKKEALAKSNEAGANIVILSAEQADEETVSYFQQRMKTVWAIAEEGIFGVLKACASGAFGIVLKDIAALEEDFSEVGGYSAVLTRNPLNIAHRGDPVIYNENSLDGCEAAYQNGASHIELDFRLTKDGEIIVMHDGSIDRTTDGSGAINQMTLEQIRNYRIIRRIGGGESGTESVIPTIDEVFEFIADKEIVLLFEIKSEEEALVEKLSEKLEAYGVEDKVVVISFDRTQLRRVRETIPYIWALDLNDFIEASLAETVKNLCESETGYDIAKGAYSLGFVSEMIDRGFMPCFWTYNDTSEYELGAERGVYGLTNNCASAAGSIGYDILVETLKAKRQDVCEGMELSYSVVNLDGECVKTKNKAVVLAYKDCGAYAECVVKASVGITTERVKIVEIPYATGGCGSVFASSVFPVISAILLLAALLLAAAKLKTRKA